MDEKQIRQIVKDELHKNYISGAPQIPPHVHDGVSNSRISEQNLIPGTKFSGTIDMTQGTITGTAPNQVIKWATYYLPCPPNTSKVSFYGGALNTTASPAIHATIVGEARMTNGYQYQPGTSNSVIVGTIKQQITQGSGSLIYTNRTSSGGATSILRNSQSYIAYAADGSNPENIYAVARISSYNNSQLTIQTAFQTNWSLSGFWMVS